MDDSFKTFAEEYRRFFAVAARCSRLLPQWAEPAVAAFVGRRFSPYRAHAATTQASMREGLRLSETEASDVWQRWLASHGLFALTVYRYGRLSTRWLQREVKVDDPDALRRIVEQGGLVLTGHTHHHNTLGCVLGLSGCHITGLAASAVGSPLYPYIGDVIERINNGSASHFGGGSYLFTDELKTLVRESKRIYAEGKVIVSLCDFSQGGDVRDLPRIDLFGRTVCPPTGAIEMAQRSQVPIHAAFLFPEQGRLRLRIRRVDGHGGPAGVLQRYFEFLATVVAASPWAWQGWDWFHTLPVTVSASEAAAPGAAPHSESPHA